MTGAPDAGTESRCFYGPCRDAFSRKFRLRAPAGSRSLFRRRSDDAGRTRRLDRAPFRKSRPDMPLPATVRREEAVLFRPERRGRPAFFARLFRFDGGFLACAPTSRGAWNERCGACDGTAMISVRDKAGGERCELLRAFIPFGGGSGAGWSKEFGIDVTERPPVLQRDTGFRACCCGFAATGARARAVRLVSDLCEGAPECSPLFAAGLCDTGRDGDTGCRAWSCGGTGHDVVAPEPPGPRRVRIPAGARRLGMRRRLAAATAAWATFPTGRAAAPATPPGSRRTAAPRFSTESRPTGTDASAVPTPATAREHLPLRPCQPGARESAVGGRVLPEGGGGATAGIGLERFVPRKNDVGAEGVARASSGPVFSAAADDAEAPADSGAPEIAPEPFRSAAGPSAAPVPASRSAEDSGPLFSFVRAECFDSSLFPCADRKTFTIFV